MNTLGCFWTAHLPNGFPRLSLGDLLLCAFGFFSVLYLLTMRVRAMIERRSGSKGTNSTHTTSTSPATTNGSTTWTKLRDISGRKTDGRGFVPELIFAAICCGLLIWGGIRSRYEKETHHNVKVWSEVAKDQWWMSDDENPTWYLYKGCEDFPNARVIWTGYVARQAVWEERGNCKSIRAVGLGFFWDRDEHGNARRIN